MKKTNRPARIRLSGSIKDKQMKPMKHEMALSGIKVLDVAQVAAVPMAARHLADFGADVIHVEHPLRGDSWRVFQPGVEGSSSQWGAPSNINYTWENYNRNKRSLGLDLSKPGGRNIIHHLVENSDVFLTNLRSFEQEKFQLQYDTLRQINPRIIYGALSGYGEKGPDKDNPGYDANCFWARAGVGNLFTRPGMSPSKDGGAFGDNASGLMLAFGIMMALFVRERTGIGQKVDLSLFNAGVYQLSWYLAGALTTGLNFEDWTEKSPEDVANPLSAPYQTQDGRWLLLTCVQADRYWPKVCRAIGREDLESDPRFLSFADRTRNHSSLYHILVDTFQKRSLADWKPRLVGIPFAPFQTLIEVTNDPEAVNNGVFASIKHPTYGNMNVISSPIVLSGTPATIRIPAPEIGQHTEEIMLESGYTWEDITKFKEQGAIS